MNSLIFSPPQTENAVTIAVTEVIGDTLCIASEDGQKVYDRIAAAFRKGQNVILSFKDGEDITSAFLVDAIGNLYAEFPKAQIEASLRIVEMQAIDADDLAYVIRDVKEYLKDPQAWKDAIRETLGEDYL